MNVGGHNTSPQSIGMHKTIDDEMRSKITASSLSVCNLSSDSAEKKLLAPQLHKKKKTILKAAILDSTLWAPTPPGCATGSFSTRDVAKRCAGQAGWWMSVPPSQSGSPRPDDVLFTDSFAGGRLNSAHPRTEVIWANGHLPVQRVHSPRQLWPQPLPDPLEVDVSSSCVHDAIYDFGLMYFS